MSCAGYAENYADDAVGQVALDHCQRGDYDLDETPEKPITWGGIWQLVFDAYEAGWSQATRQHREALH